jgi:hypothetical protein
VVSGISDIVKNAAVFQSKAMEYGAIFFEHEGI